MCPASPEAAARGFRDSAAAVWQTRRVGWLTFSELDAAAARFDAQVARTPSVDLFCTSSAWVMPAQQAFAADAEPLIFEDDDCIVALMVVRTASGVRVAVPLEAGWGLASPMVGPRPDRAAERLHAMVHGDSLSLGGVFLSGLERGGHTWRAVIERFARTTRIGIGPRCPRRCADLQGGVDGFLSRRSAGFRANLRRAWRLAAGRGVRFERHQGGEPSALFARIRAIEVESWKGRAGEGIDEGPPRDFYLRMLHRLVVQGDLRVIFATHDGVDLAFVFGAVFAGTYRGLQVSFDRRQGQLAPGNLVQYAMIQWLCEDGVESYDLGTDMPYKERWAEPGLETHTLALLPMG